MNKSLRSRLWQGIAALAVVNAACGAIGFFCAQYFGLSIPYTVLASVVPGVIAALILARPFVDSVIAPVNAAGLAAKTLERNPDAALPATTGAAETDEIAQSLQRSSRQLTAYAHLMQKVAAGETSQVVLPLESPDKLVTAFQSLVKQVVDSVDAKRDLEELKNTIAAIETELHIILDSGSFRTLSGAAPSVHLTGLINELLFRADTTIRSARTASADTEPVLVSAMLGIRNVTLSAEESITGLHRLITSLKKSPDRAREFSDESSAFAASGTKAAATFGSQKSDIQTLTARAATIQRQHTELNRKIRKLRERSVKISEAARSIEDIARRSNLIALNTSITAAEGPGTGLMASEFRLVADRADRAQKEMNAVEKALDQEILDIESMLRHLLAESSDITVVIASAVEMIDAVSPLTVELKEFPHRIEKLVQENSQDREDLMRSLTTAFFGLETIVPQLRESEQSMLRVRRFFELANTATVENPRLEVAVDA
ncbi:MAG: methyl-accepting chemotaxis protein [Pyrinomonadaceae bacterium]|nr:methyl-accepting chemotaxis protein [Pyrinomonadaceae bacterium]